MKAEDTRWLFIFSVIVGTLVIGLFALATSGIGAFILDPEPETELLVRVLR